jgi:hypothetical protein
VTRVLRYLLACDECDVRTGTSHPDCILYEIADFLDEHWTHSGVWVCPPGTEPGATMNEALVGQSRGAHG